MKRVLAFLAALVLTFAFMGCATTSSGVGSPRAIHFTKVDNWAPGLVINAISATRNGKDVDFEVSLKSEIERSFSFFDPPNGDIVMYQSGGIVVGDNLLTFSIAVSDLQKLKNVTMGFGFVGTDRNFISLNLYDIKRLSE